VEKSSAFAQRRERGVIGQARIQSGKAGRVGLAERNRY